LGAPAVSFIVPLYNCLPYSQAMLASLQATMPAGLAHEIILVDDGSTDGTREWLKGGARGDHALHLGIGSRLQVLLNSQNSGYAKSNNRAAASAKGDLFVLLNNDLVLRPGWLEPMLALHGGLARRGQAGAIGNVQYRVSDGAIDHTGIVINAKAKPEHRKRAPVTERLRGFSLVPAVTGACLLISAELWRTLGGFDEGYFNGCEDVDLCFRAAELGRTNAVALRSAVDHHVSASPNRNARNEANAHRLARSWAERLSRLAEMAWTQAYFERYLPEPRDYPDRRLAGQAALCRYGLRRRPPARAAEGARAALAIEFARWRSLEHAAASAPCP
jgi:GT2 family glycosyltransferase